MRCGCDRTVGTVRGGGRAHLEALLANAGFARVIVRVVPADVHEVARDLRRLRDSYEARFEPAHGCGSSSTRLRPHAVAAAASRRPQCTQTWYVAGAGRSDPNTIARQFMATLRHGAAGIRGPKR